MENIVSIISIILFYFGIFLFVCQKLNVWKELSNPKKYFGSLNCLFFWMIILFIFCIPIIIFKILNLIVEDIFIKKHWD